MTHTITLFGAPGVIEEMRRAAWYHFADDGSSECEAHYFDGLAFYGDSDEHISSQPSEFYPVRCRIEVANNGSALPIIGHVSREIIPYLERSSLCILGRWRDVKQIDYDGKVTCVLPMRDPFTTAPDGNHTVPYTFTFILD